MIEQQVVQKGGHWFFFERSCAHHNDRGSLWACWVLSELDKITTEESGTIKPKTKATKTPQTNNNHNRQKSLTNHGEKVKHAQSLTAICTSPALIIDLLPLFSSRGWCISLTTKKLHRNDLLFLSYLCINVGKDSMSPGKSIGGPGWRKLHSWAFAVCQ